MSIMHACRQSAHGQVNPSTPDLRSYARDDRIPFVSSVRPLGLKSRNLTQITTVDRRIKGKHAGMTLLEIVVAFAVMALLMMIAIPSIESYSGVNVREEAGRISGAIRFMHGESALSGKVCRLVFDIDQRHWWAECSSANHTVVQQNGAFSPNANNSTKEKDAKTEEFLDEVEELRAKIEKKAEFSQFQDEEISKRKLPENTQLSIWTSHQKEKIKKGQAFLYFFPQGNTERAHITISGQYGDTYTLTVSPLTGRVRVVNGELSVPQDGG